jgi:hypothetical protein
MSWCAETNQGKFGRGTAMAVYEQPWGPGLAVHSLPAQATVALRLADNTPVQLVVLEVGQNGAVIQAPDETKWLVVQIDPGKLMMRPPSPAGANVTFWVVKDPVVDGPTADTSSA